MFHFHGSAKPNALFLTGVTGFLGRTLLADILSSGSFSTLYMLAKDRINPPMSAFERVRALVEEAAIHKCLGVSAEDEALFVTAPGRPPIRLVPITGDITQENLGFSETIDLNQVTHVCHAAAITELVAPWESFQRVNVQGTHNMLDFAARHFPKLQLFAHVGTAYDLYDGKGAFLSAVHPPEPQTFVNDYSRSKWLARKAVVESGLPYCICLPSIITGRSSDGFLPDDVPLGVIYGPLQGMALLKSICRPFYKAGTPLNLNFHTPGDPAATLNVIPVDTVAALLNRILAAPQPPCRKIFYLTNPQLLPIRHILETGAALLGVNGIQLVRDLRSRTALEKLFARILAPYQPFMNGNDSLCDLSSLQSLAGDILIPAPDVSFLQRMFSYVHLKRNWAYDQPGSFYKENNVLQLQKRFGEDIRSLIIPPTLLP